MIIYSIYLCYVRNEPKKVPIKEIMDYGQISTTGRLRVIYNIPTNICSYTIMVKIFQIVSKINEACCYHLNL